MLELYTKFCEDLELPEGTWDNLSEPRDNEEMDVFIKNLPSLLYPDTYKLAGRLFIYTNIKNIPKKIESYVAILRGLLSDSICDFMLLHSETINSVLEKTYYQNFEHQDMLSASANVNYLLRVSADEPPVETPCQLIMRQAVQFYFEDGIEYVLECYYQILDQYYVHASPTMFNSGLKKNQLASCFEKDTKVFTHNRGYIPIIDVKIGDIVHTHKNRMKKVVQLHKNRLNKRQMYKVKCEGSNEFKVTGNHRFYVVNSEDSLIGDSWYSIEILKAGDYIMNYKKNKGIDKAIIEYIIPIDDKPEFVYTLGVENDHSYCVEGVIAENCFLLNLSDNLESLLYSGAGDVGLISKLQGGIGLSLSSIRHSNVSNTGKSSGVLPFGQIYDATIKCVNQGGKRNGAMTVTLNDWHIDFIDFVQTRDNYTHNGIRFKQANICAFISKLFMDRVAKKENWTFFCPAKVKDLVGLSGQEFEEKYLNYEKQAIENKIKFDKLEKEIKELEIIMNTGEYNEKDSINYFEKTVERVKMRKLLIDFKIERADKIYTLICSMQIRSSMPYICYRDAMNLKNNTSNIAPTMSSNLCVAPETIIMTRKGGFKIVEYENQEVEVWNGYEFSKVIVKKTGENQELIKVVFNEELWSGPRELECTRYHKFYIIEDDKEKEYRAEELKPGMRLVNFIDPENRTERINNYVKDVIITGRKDDTYCFTEPKRNRAYFNGVCVGNCLEITLPANNDIISSCNLGHLNLKKYAYFTRNEIVTKENITDYFDFEKLAEMTRVLVRNINKVIDYNYYPLDKRNKKGEVIKRGKISQPNFDNRPLGIGVSGLAEAFAFLNLPYEDELSIYLNKLIFACIYYNAIIESMELAKIHGPYKNYKTGESTVFIDGKWEKINGSKIANGYFQFDLWHQETEYLKSINRFNSKINKEEDNIPLHPSEWGQEGDWDELRKYVQEHGVYNSMLVALMPTASSAQLLRNAETTEAHQTLFYSRKLVHGNYTAFSEPFYMDMKRFNLWNQKALDFIEMDNGSFQNFHIFYSENPQYFKDSTASFEDIRWMQKVHKGMYEISQKVCMQMARQRGIYVCQSQSLNIWIGEPNMTKMKAVHSYGNALNLKTGMYYLRANPASQTNRFTLSLETQEYYHDMKRRKKDIQEKKVVCQDDVCIMCQ